MGRNRSLAQRIPKNIAIQPKPPKRTLKRKSEKKRDELAQKPKQRKYE